jgi:hypothetical protein
MIREIKGEISSGPGPNRFAAEFKDENGISHIFRGQLAGDLPPWKASLAYLTFEKEIDLVGAVVFTGQIGSVSVALKIGNATLRGELDDPIEKEASVTGEGVWNVM